MWIRGIDSVEEGDVLALEFLMVFIVVTSIC